jgi:uridine phosphorylase
MERREFPIIEFDPSPTATVDPTAHIRPADVPEHCVPIFFQDVVDRILARGGAREIACMGSEMGRHPLYETVRDGRRVAFFQPGITAPFAAAMLEEVIAFGCRTFVACGGAGVLDRHVAVGSIIVPTAAVRDEGTSYHYLPASREVAPSPAAVEAIRATLDERGVDYVTAKTWTTDAIYRETPERIRARRAEGCLTVEMEASAFFAVAAFRNVTFGQILYGGDDVSGDEWDHRDWNRQSDVRDRLFELAAAACLRL